MSERIVYKRNSVRVRVCLFDDGLRGSVYPEREVSLNNWICVRRYGGGGNKPFCFNVPGGRWPWNRSMERAIMLAVDWIQREEAARMLADQRLALIEEQIAAFTEALNA